MELLIRILVDNNNSCRLSELLLADVVVCLVLHLCLFVCLFVCVFVCLLPPASAAESVGELILHLVDGRLSRSLSRSLLHLLPHGPEGVLRRCGRLVHAPAGDPDSFGFGDGFGSRGGTRISVDCIESISFSGGKKNPVLI